MNLKPWLAYAQKTLCELRIPEDGYSAVVADLAEGWIRELAGESEEGAGAGTDADASAGAGDGSGGAGADTSVIGNVDAGDGGGGAGATAGGALRLKLAPPDNIPLSEAILYLSALQPEHQTLTHKQSSGQYFTPLNLADILLDKTVCETERARFGSSRLTILDPACGSGVFLYAAARLAAQIAGPDKFDTPQKRAAFVRKSLFGIEKDPQVARLARATLIAWIMEGQSSGAGGTEAAEGLGVRAEAERETGAKAETEAEAIQIAAAKILCGDALLGDAWRDRHFDYLVGNPPFLGVRRGRIPDSEKAALQHRFTTARGQFDLYAVFVEDALTRIKKGGSIAFVLPRPLLSNDHSAPLRQLLATQTTVHEILDFGMPFQAGVEIIGLVASGKPEVAICRTCQTCRTCRTCRTCQTCRTQADSASSERSAAEHAGTDFRGRELPVMLLHTPENALVGLVERLAAEFPSLHDLAESWRGLECGKRDANITESRTAPDALPVLRGNDVQRYTIKTPTCYYSAAAANESHMAGAGIRKRDIFSRKFPAGKLLVRRVFPGLAAAYDPDPNLTLNTIYILMPRQSGAKTPYAPYLPWFLLGVINSGIASFWFKNAFVFRETLFPYVRLSQLRRLPCPPPDHPYAAELAELARGLSLEYQKGGSPDSEALLQQKEKQLETLLADMLALTESERQLINASLSQTGSK